LFRAFRDVSWAYERSRNDYRRLAGEAREHLAIVEALLADDPKAAARAMSHHIRAGIKYWSRALPALRASQHAPPDEMLLKSVDGHRARAKSESNSSARSTALSNGKSKLKPATRVHHA
jgi:hypothetical protein